MKYKIITISRSAHAYIVEAGSKEEAEEQFDKSNFIDNFEEIEYSKSVDSEEEIVSIEEYNEDGE